MNYNDLRDNIKSLDIQDLIKMLTEYNKGIISEQEYESIKLIVNEIEYRRLSKYIKNSVDLKVLVKYNYDFIWKINDDEIEKSIKFLDNSKINYDGLLRWVPLCLSMNLVYSLYKKNKENKLSDEEIYKVLISDVRLNLDNEVDKDNKYGKDKEFISFINRMFNSLNSRRKDTDTYKRMMDELIEENSYTLNHLR